MKTAESSSRQIPTPSLLYEEAESFVYSLISGVATPAEGTTRQEIHRRATQRLARLRAFLAFLGNPQDQYRTVHIGGTSGKGSTTELVAAILSEAGFKTGSHVSPYLQVATEKLEINGQIASARTYHDLVTHMREQVARWVAQDNPTPTYGEFWVAMTFVYFARQQVDFAVIEVGAGGRYDLTNVIAPDVAAISSIGFDHTRTLGATLEEIAWHKAGILKPGAAAVTAVTDAEPLWVIEDEAARLGVELARVQPGRSYRDIRTSASGTSFVDTVSGLTFQMQLSGDFQAANGALAAAIVRSIPGIDVDDETIARGLAKARFPGRMEVVQSQPRVMLDGAHNPQKISGLASNIEQLFGAQRVILVFGALDTKEYGQMLRTLAPHVDALIATEPRVYAKPAVPASNVAAAASGLIKTVDAAPEPLDALDRALGQASEHDAILVTGSLYLVGNVREHWYPTVEILEQGTIWPD